MFYFSLEYFKLPLKLVDEIHIKVLHKRKGLLFSYDIICLRSKILSHSKLLQKIYQYHRKDLNFKLNFIFEFLKDLR